jgi:hypothetical protein
MRAIVSGESGLGVLEQADHFLVYDHERQIWTRDARDEGLWSLLYTPDVSEVSVDSADELASIVATRWTQDRTLRLVIILFDGSERTVTRRAAAQIADRRLADELVWQFVARKLYSSPLPLDGSLTSAIEIANATGQSVARLVRECSSDQDSIFLVREAWQRIGSAAFESTWPKPVIEEVFVRNGVFLDLVTRTTNGIASFAQAADELITVAGLDKSNRALVRVTHAWLSELELDHRALIGIQGLTNAQGCRVRRYANRVIKALGSKARGRDYHAFIHTAAMAAAKAMPAVTDASAFYEALWKQLPATFVSWHEEIFEAVTHLSHDDLIRLRKYAMWRLRPLGAKAEAREPDDLVQEAITSTLSGDRIWSEGVELLDHLLGAIRSISTKWREKKLDVRTESSLITETNQEPLETASDADNPATAYEAKERLNKVATMLENDDTALSVFKLISNHYTREDVRDRLGLSELEYSAAVRRIWRRVKLANA